MATAQRYLRRLQRAVATDDDFDDMLSFFVHAWHMVDWASNDPTIGRSYAVVKADAVTSRAIRECADLADGIKHLILTKPVRPYAQMTHKNIHASDGAGAGAATATYTYTLTDGSEIDAVSFAGDVLADWKTILTGYGVIL